MINALISALKRYGTREVKGEESDPFIIECIDSCEHDPSLLEDSTTAWCSAFINKVCKDNCLEHTNSLSARSWLKVGEEIENPEIGDVCILWRSSPKSWKGHVGLFLRMDDTKIWILGGNQKNKVSIQYYPKSRLLGYRRLRTIEKLKG